MARPLLDKSPSPPEAIDFLDYCLSRASEQGEALSYDELTALRACIQEMMDVVCYDD